MLISLMALSPQRKLHSGLSGQIKLAIYGLLSLALTPFYGGYSFFT
ncbi:hypothetical protein [Candidatus Regiella endosymbiont of Tuberolachnus salignus]